MGRRQILHPRAGTVLQHVPRPAQLRLQLGLRQQRQRAVLVALGLDAHARVLQGSNSVPVQVSRPPHIGAMDEKAGPHAEFL